MTQVASDSKRCTYCGEMIRVEAQKCRYCGEWLSSAPSMADALRADKEVRTPGVRMEAPAPTSKFNGLALASLLITLFGGGLGGPVAVPLGVRARKQIKDSKGSQRGDALALTGIVLGGIQCVLLAVVFVVVSVHLGAQADHKNAAKQSMLGLVAAEEAYYQHHGSYTNRLDLLAAEGAVIRPGVRIAFYTFSPDAYCLTSGYQGKPPYFAGSSESLQPDGSISYWESGVCGSLT